jgi:hypothetical protein
VPKALKRSVVDHWSASKPAAPASAPAASARCRRFQRWSTTGPPAVNPWSTTGIGTGTGLETKPEGFESRSECRMMAVRGGMCLMARLPYWLAFLSTVPCPKTSPHATQDSCSTSAGFCHVSTCRVHGSRFRSRFQTCLHGHRRRCRVLRIHTDRAPGGECGRRCPLDSTPDSSCSAVLLLSSHDRPPNHEQPTRLRRVTDSVCR